MLQAIKRMQQEPTEAELMIVSLMLSHPLAYLLTHLFLDTAKLIM